MQIPMDPIYEFWGAFLFRATHFGFACLMRGKSDPKVVSQMVVCLMVMNAMVQSVKRSPLLNLNPWLGFSMFFLWEFEVPPQSYPPNK